MHEISQSNFQELAAGMHALDATKVCSVLDVDPATGLSGKEAKDRLRTHGPNKLRTHPPANLLWVLTKQFNSAVVYLLIGAAIFAALLGEQVETIAIVAVLAINALIGFVTELRAVRSMEALRALASRSVLVRRDGDTVTIPAENLVPGNIVILDAGDVLSADMRILASANLASDESSLTGESLPVEKSPAPVNPDTILAERTSMLFKGCAITNGTGEAVVTATGMATELGSITRLVEQSEPERSPLEKQLAELSRNLIWLTIGITALLATIGILAGQDVNLMIKSAVALAVAAIPEGLPIVATLALARGMLRMAKHNALIERLSAVQTLGGTTVILTDKTGTLTENRMHVDRIVTSNGEVSFDRHAQNFIAEGHTTNLSAEHPLTLLLRNAALCNNATLGRQGKPATGDPMEVALLKAASAANLSRPDLLARYEELCEYAFDVENRMMATVHRHETDCLIAAKGAPEAVFECIHDVYHQSGRKPFNNREREKWNKAVDLLAEQGLRLLAIAGKCCQSTKEQPYRNLTLYGIVGFQDPPRADIASAIADARRAGIKVVMVTGDHAATAKHISSTVGISGVDQKAVGGAELKNLREVSEPAQAALRDVLVFSRVAPEQKLDLITLHQRAGEIVAMTGDGVNDAPALRKADIGIAMGLRGTQVAREAADMVLRDDSFSTIIHAIREGRVILTNIRRFTTYLLSCNLSEILIVGLAVLAGLPLPLLPLQILFLNLVTDVFPALALGTIEGDENALLRPPRPPSEPILTRKQWKVIILDGVLIALTTLAALLVAIFPLALKDDAITTFTFFTLALAQLWHVFNMRNWREAMLFNQITRNTYVWLAIVVCLLILAVAALQPDMADALKLVPLDGKVWLILLGLSSLPLLIRQAAGKTKLMMTSPRHAP
jgi:Ca2+-transporting ATPase